MFRNYISVRVVGILVGFLTHETSSKALIVSKSLKYIKLDSLAYNYGMRVFAYIQSDCILFFFSRISHSIQLLMLTKFNLVQSCSILFNLVQSCSILFNLVSYFVFCYYRISHSIQLLMLTKFLEQNLSLKLLKVMKF